MALITIANDQLKVTISSVGAELQSITDKNGRERLWNGDPAFWTGRAYVLFPVAGGFRDDYYELDGERYEMPKHGFVRKAQWQVEEAAPERAVFLIRDQHPGFPFEYDLRAIYALKGNALEVCYQVSSRDERPFYFSVGCHEGYMTPEGIEEYEIVFDEEERLAPYKLEGSCNLHETDLIAENARVHRGCAGIPQFEKQGRGAPGGEAGLQDPGGFPRSSCAYVLAEARRTLYLHRMLVQRPRFC